MLAACFVNGRVSLRSGVDMLSATYRVNTSRTRLSEIIVKERDRVTCKQQASDYDRVRSTVDAVGADVE
jgi:hypothetical protein